MGTKEVSEVTDSEEVIDLDLKAEDAKLREAIGHTTNVKIDGVVVHISHVAEWSTAAMNAASRAEWEDWAAEAILDDGERDTFIDANLAAYQLNAIFETCSKAGGTTTGKSRRSRR